MKEKILREKNQIQDTSVFNKKQKGIMINLNSRFFFQSIKKLRTSKYLSINNALSQHLNEMYLILKKKKK